MALVNRCAQLLTDNVKWKLDETWSNLGCDIKNSTVRLEVAAEPANHR